MVTFKLKLYYWYFDYTNSFNQVTLFIRLYIIFVVPKNLWLFIMIIKCTTDEIISILCFQCFNAEIEYHLNMLESFLYFYLKCYKKIILNLNYVFFFFKSILTIWSWQNNKFEFEMLYYIFATSLQYFNRRLLFFRFN